MKEEELIKKLENTALPGIEVQSHRRRLRMALLDSEYFREQPEVGVFGQVSSTVKRGVDVLRGLISWRPIWKPALVSTLAIALIVGSALFVPSLVGPSTETLAADIAKSSPEVRALVGGEPVILDTKVTNGTAYVLCLGPFGESAISIVDVKNETELRVVKLKSELLCFSSELLRLSDEEKAKAIEIAEAGPRVQGLLSDGGNITKVVAFPMKVSIKVIDDELRVEEEAVLAGVIVVLGEEEYVVQVDLAKEEIVNIIAPVDEES